MMINLYGVITAADTANQSAEDAESISLMRGDGYNWSFATYEGTGNGYGCELGMGSGIHFTYLESDGEGYGDLSEDLVACYKCAHM